MSSAPEVADSGLAARAQQLEDKEAIRTLTATYAHHVAAGEMEKVPPLFTADARFVASQTLNGRAEIEAFYAIKRSGSPFPLVTNHVVTVTGKTAVGTCAMYSPVSSGGTSFCGVYQDKYARSGDRWLFAERVFTTYHQPAGAK